MSLNRPPSLGPELYNQEYYRKSLPGLEYLEKDIVDPAIAETIRFGRIASESRVLDFGCGRGNLILELAKRGASAVGVDFSLDAIEFAKSYAAGFPQEIQKRVRFMQLSMNEMNFEQEFDVIVFNQVYEHLYDWELKILLAKFKRALKKHGILVISTPNLDYIRYLFPLKRTLEFPFKLIKETLRVIRGKSKHASSPQKFLKEIFKIKYPDSEHTRFHINLQTPVTIQKFLTDEGFSVQAVCLDRHTNWLSRLTERWWGETIWVSSQLRTS